MQKTHIFDQFADGEATQQVEEKLFWDIVTMYEDYDENMLSLTHDVVELNERKAFLEGVASFLGKDTATSAEELFAEVKVRYKEKGIELTKTVKNWFQKKTSPSTDTKYRHNQYDFCIAMGMDYQMTAEFFLKAFLTIPYNYKDRHDAVYFYCLKAGRPYSVIKQMLAAVDSFEETNAEVDSTEQIGLQILGIDTDEAFLEYLQKHCYDKKHQYATAKEKLRHLVEANKRILPERNPIEKEGIKEGAKLQKMQEKANGQRIPSNIELLDAILGYSYQSLDSAQRALMQECGLPQFPTDGNIGDILDASKDVSFDVLRKSLILMQFYNFYQSWFHAKKQAYMEESEIIENLHDFCESMNKALAECGFTQLYVRNPYDWIILFCANSSNPVDYLQDFIAKRYRGIMD